MIRPREFKNLVDNLPNVSQKRQLHQSELDKVVGADDPFVDVPFYDSFSDMPPFNLAVEK